MKCKYCNGFGYIDNLEGDGFLCPKCSGTGEQELFDTDVELDKLYPIEQTNDVWRKNCSAEEFTEELVKVVLDLVSWNNDPKPSEVRNILKAWLKRPHK